jgi:hypothetical protein
LAALAFVNLPRATAVPGDKILEMIADILVKPTKDSAFELPHDGNLVTRGRGSVIVTRATFDSVYYQRGDYSGGPNL